MMMMMMMMMAMMAVVVEVIKLAYKAGFDQRSDAQLCAIAGGEPDPTKDDVSCIGKFLDVLRTYVCI